jgi:hypothetical protein
MNVNSNQLLTNFSDDARCSNCDTILKASIYRKKPIVFCLKHTRNRSKTKIFCIRCSLKPTLSSNKSKVTKEQVDSFLGLEAE